MNSGDMSGGGKSGSGGGNSCRAGEGAGEAREEWKEEEDEVGDNGISDHQHRPLFSHTTR